MGGKLQLLRRTSLIFFFLGVAALGLQLAGIVLPFWLEDDWRPVARAALGRRDGPSIRIFQGLWTDYRCNEAYQEEYGNPRSGIITSDCATHLQDSDSAQGALSRNLRTLRILEVLSLVLGFVSDVGVICLYVTAHRSGCLHVLSQIFFTFPALLAGFLALIGVLILAGEKGSTNLSWGLAFPTVAGFLWLINCSFSFAVCSFRPAGGGLEVSVSMRALNKHADP